MRKSVGTATHPLRQGTIDEIKNAVQVTVELAHGATQLYQNPVNLFEDWWKGAGDHVANETSADIWFWKPIRTSGGYVGRPKSPECTTGGVKTPFVRTIQHYLRASTG